MRSIFGECTGNVRSTPTPNDCLRTVNVSRTPAPWRLSTIPSKTCTRRRWPSITWKCTRTVSPALNGGRFVRSCCCSRLSITLLIERGPSGRRGMLAERDSVRRPVGREHGPDQVLARHGTPAPRVARVAAVVAHEEVLPDRHAPALLAVGGVAVAPLLLDVRLVQLLVVDQDEALLVLVDEVARQADQPFDEDAALPALLLRRGRGLEDHDLAAVGVAEPVDEAVGQHPVGEARLATDARPRAVERRLHRRRGDLVRVDDPGLDRQHEPDRDGDGHDPVDRDPPGPREALGQPVDRVSQWSVTRFGGQYVANTLPIRFLRGTEPQRRESHDSPRLSPMKK